MKARIPTLLFLLPLLAVPIRAQTEEVVSFRGGAKFPVTVPMGYSFEPRTNSDGSIGFRMENPVWHIYIDAVIGQESDPAVTTREWQQNKLVSFIATDLADSQESDYTFQPLRLRSGTGVYCVFTARGATRPRPGEVIPGSFATSGLKAWRGYVVIFRINSPDITSPEYQEAFQVFTQSVNKQ